MAKLGKLEKIIIGLPIAAFLYLQGAEINWSFKSYNYQLKAQETHNLSRAYLKKANYYFEVANHFRDEERRAKEMQQREKGQEGKDPRLSDLYWGVKTNADLNEEDNGRNYWLYKTKDKEARQLSIEAMRLKQRANKYGPVSNMRKLAAKLDKIF
jgi:hypothetical protein